MQTWPMANEIKCNMAESAVADRNFGKWSLVDV
jgi:hypothetical protein